MIRLNGYAALVVLALGVSACGPPPPPPALAMQSKWYLYEPSGNRDLEWPEFHLYLGIVNWGDPVIVDSVKIVGMKDPENPIPSEEWPKGVLREFDLGRFKCTFPTSVQVLVHGLWRDTKPLDGYMPTSLPADPKSCPGLTAPDAEDQPSEEHLQERRPKSRPKKGRHRP